MILQLRYYPVRIFQNFHDNVTYNLSNRKTMEFYISKLPEYLLCSIFQIFKNVAFPSRYAPEFFKHNLIISFYLRLS